jgi:PPOX class probable F420-dependent enzyme
MREMISAEGREFLVGRARTASLATVRAEGRPQVAPIWFDLDGETLLFITGEGTVKGRNMVRDSRASLCIDENDPPFNFVLIGGAAVLASGDPDHLY